MTVQTATTFTIDPVHSTVEFAVKHMMIATVRGRFGEFEGTIRFDAPLSELEANSDIRDAYLSV